MFYPYNYTVSDLLDRMAEVELRNSNAKFVDKGDYFCLTTPLVGARKEDVNIFVKEGTQLAISYNPKEKNPYAPSFSQSWRLDGVDPENVTASLNDGLLTVVIPKLKAVQPKVRTVAVN
jgi:HSP20 family molecular chaperone IbpA